MIRKILSAVLCVVILICTCSPAFAVQSDEVSEQRTVEEILNEYHEKSFAAKVSDEANEAAAYSARGAANEKTLEDETVDALADAGYEAYNVTSDNYDTLEETLKTDFSEMGLTEDGSYIIVIGAEDDAETNAPQPRVGDLPEYDYGDEGAGSSYFNYTYNGNTYKMRYVTVTAADYSWYAQTSSVNVQDVVNANSWPGILYENLSVAISVATLMYDPFYIGAMNTIIGAHIENFGPNAQDELRYSAVTNWTLTYIQVYDSDRETWIAGSSKEYITSYHIINYTYYDATLNHGTQNTIEGSLGYDYSPKYNDATWLKNSAALAYEQGMGVYGDYVDSVTYKLGGYLMITHTRQP